MAQLPDTSDRLEGEERAIYEEMVRRRAPAPLPGPYVPLLSHPRLAQLVERFGYYLKYESELPRDVYEFVVLSVARRIEVPYIWLDHAGPARKAGLPEEAVEALARGDSSRLAGGLRAVTQAVEHILSFRSLPDLLQEEITAYYGVKGLVEIVVVCGFYQIMGMVSQSFDVPPPSKEKPPF